MADIIITKGRPYELVFEMKAPNSPTEEILPDDAVAIMHIISKEKLGTSVIVKEMTRVPELPDPVDGYTDSKFKLELDATETSLLPFEFGYVEDDKRFRDTCRGHIAIDSPNSPDDKPKHADALISSIYVADLGL